MFSRSHQSDYDEVSEAGDLSVSSKSLAKRENSTLREQLYEVEAENALLRDEMKKLIDFFESVREKEDASDEVEMNISGESIEVMVA